MEEKYAIFVWWETMTVLCIWIQQLSSPPPPCNALRSSDKHPFFASGIADLVITHALEWPSLTVQWLPVSPATIAPPSASQSKRRFSLMIHPFDGKIFSSNTPKQGSARHHLEYVTAVRKSLHKKA
jgi:Histone-binding protein RBBP4 or subunit C of CAF1 complex